jgi:thiamine-phosphate pyrophosphorylase
VNADARSLPDSLRLIYVVDREASRDWQRLDAVCSSGVTAIWLRAPGVTGAQLYRTTRDLLWRCHERGVALIVGDRADVALAAGADGVQLGFRSPPARRIRPWFAGWIGVSCHSEPELRSAERGGADYAVLSPIFGVPQKGAPLGTALFAKLCEDLELPIVGLGGVDPTNAAAVRAAGAAGVAVIRSLRDAAEPAAAARHLSGAMTPR